MTFPIVAAESHLFGENYRSSRAEVGKFGPPSSRSLSRLGYSPDLVSN